MTKAEDLINYYRTPKIAIDEKFQCFFDEVYKLSSLEIHAKIHKLTKGFNRLDQLIGIYNLYNSYIYFKSDPIFLKEMGEDEFTLFKRQFDVVKLNELTVITLHKDKLVFESYELLKRPNIDVYKRQTFSDILEQLIKSEYAKTKPQQGEPAMFDLSESSGPEKTIIIEPCGEMFSNNGFELFEYILKEHVKPKDTKGRKSDLIYYYWEMFNSTPQYIHQRPTTFFNWFENEYKEITGQLKTYDNVRTLQRKKDYSTALDWFKSKNK